MLLIKTKRIGGVFFYNFFKINILKIKRAVDIKGGGQKHVSYEYFLFGLYKIFTKKFIFNGKKPMLDGGGNMAWGLAEYLKNTATKTDFENLFKNLDNESTNILKRVIDRLIYSLDNPTKPVVDLKKSEQLEQAKIYDNFINKIEKVDENTYRYKNYYLPKNAFEISVMYHEHSMDVLDKRTLERIKQECIIDAGAYIGDSAIVLSKYTDQKIYSFEVDPGNMNLFKKTIEMNNIKNAILIPKGLGSKNEEICFSMDSGGFSASVDKNGDIIAEIITLDKFVEQNNIKIGFIKLDIEGEETNFLLGAKNTIITQKPAMLISIYHRWQDFLYIKPMLESWGCNYTFKIHKPIDYSVSGETALYCECI